MPVIGPDRPEGHGNVGHDEHTWAVREWAAMGSIATVLVWAPHAESLVAWAQTEVERLEQCWSRFRPDSELSALNRWAGTPDVVVSTTLGLALDRAHDAHALTEGRFDPTVLPTLAALGYDRTFSAIAAASNAPGAAGTSPRVLPRPRGFGSVEVHHDGGIVRVTMPADVAIDLGGIGKGLGADVVVDGLIARGATSACVSLGGDIRVAGPGPDIDSSWLVPVEDATTGATRFSFPLVDEAIAQSTVRMRRWIDANGRPQHHLIDPSTGEPARRGVVSAVATAPDAWQADVIAKATLIAGVDDGMALLARCGFDGWLFCADGEILTTPAVADTLVAAQQ